jgi:hypothetical protein
MKDWNFWAYIIQVCLICTGTRRVHFGNCKIWVSHSAFMSSFIFWDISLPDFTLVSCFAYSSTIKIEATCSSETSVDSQWTTRQYIQENKILHIGNCLLLFKISYNAICRRLELCSCHVLYACSASFILHSRQRRRRSCRMNTAFC